VNPDLPGFDKNAPTSRPSTRSQPISAWDVDVSPFHRLVEQQIAHNQQLTDTFAHRLEELVNILRDDKTQNDKKLQALQEKLVQTYKTQAKDNDSLRENMTELVEQMHKMQQLLQEVAEKSWRLLENIQKNTHEMLRPMMNQENLLREGFAPAQILQPIEKLVALEEGAYRQVQSLVNSSQETQSLQESSQKQSQLFMEHMSELEKKLESLENVLLSLGKQQSHFPDKAFFSEQFSQLLVEQNKLINQVAQAFDRISDPATNSEGYKNFERMLQRQQEMLKHKESVAFWVFAIVALFLAGWVFLTILTK
jgi:hypothetical protein